MRLFSLQASYKLILISRVTEVNPGDRIEIEIFLSGYGKIARNKLRLCYSPDLVDKEDSGVIESCISSARDKNTGKYLHPVSGKKYIVSHNLTQDGAYIVMEEGNFDDYPQTNGARAGRSRRRASIFGYPSIMSEYKWDSHPPILLKLNTSEKTPSGDYEISVILTYSDGKFVHTEKAFIPIHVKTLIERHQWKIAVIGLAIAVTSPMWGEVLSHLVRTHVLPFI